MSSRECGPYKNVSVGLQEFKNTVQVVRGDAERAVWEAEVTVGRAADGQSVARGPAIHGPRTERFLYLVWTGSGPTGEGMFRRAKLPLDAVSDDVFDAVVATGHPLLGEVGLTDRHGMPLCASVRPPLIRWSIG